MKAGMRSRSRSVEQFSSLPMFKGLRMMPSQILARFLDFSHFLVLDNFGSHKVLTFSRQSTQVGLGSGQLDSDGQDSRCAMRSRYRLAML